MQKQVRPPCRRPLRARRHGGHRRRCGVSSGWSSGSICFGVSSLWGRFAVSQTIIPEAQEHFLTPLARRDTHPFGGLGIRENSRCVNSDWGISSLPHAHYLG